MIHHISFSAQNPEETAKTLAKFWNTQALPFPMYENAHIVFCGENTGSCIEVYPAGKKLTPSSPELPAFKDESTEMGGSFHAALSIPLEEDKVKAICEEAGWFTQTGPRGPFFHVIEVWVEDHTLLELLTPTMTKEYTAFASFENWKKIFTEQMQE